MARSLKVEVKEIRHRTPDEVRAGARNPLTHVQGFTVTASNLDACKEMAKARLEKLGFKLRSMSFAPDPRKTGEIYIVAVVTRPAKEKK